MKIYKRYTLSDEELFEMAKPEMDAISKDFPLSAINEMLETQIEGDSMTSCIYGILTGNCNSEEVKTFIQKNVKNLIIIDSRIPIENAFNEGSHRSIYYETPLEQYIFPTKEEQHIVEDLEEGWPESYNERIERVKTYIKSKINETIS